MWFPDQQSQHHLETFRPQNLKPYAVSAKSGSSVVQDIQVICMHIKIWETLWQSMKNFTFCPGSEIYIKIIIAFQVIITIIIAFQAIATKSFILLSNKLLLNGFPICIHLLIFSKIQDFTLILIKFHCIYVNS